MGRVDGWHHPHHDGPVANCGLIHLPQAKSNQAKSYPEIAISIVRSETDLNACLHLRHVVFVEEQGVPVELEIDGHDLSDAVHFIGKLNNKCVATARICIFGNKAKIQRVAIDRSHRGAGYGRMIMQGLIDHIRAENLAPFIALDAQTYALPFYTALGFVRQGEEFDDAGIPHVHMVQPA